MRRSCPLMLANDTTETLAWYVDRGFDVIRDIGGSTEEDLHLLMKDGETFAQIMDREAAHAFFPETAGVPVGTVSGWYYLNLDNADEYIDSIKDCVDALKDADHANGRLFYFRDLNGYIIGIITSWLSDKPGRYRTTRENE
jgi:catechol 2,3-dioxygenase-like lactoylglutathione lyase family enzyme